jgi:hypothetical protein
VCCGNQADCGCLIGPAAMKDATIAAASGLPFETWISRSLAACLFVPLLFPPMHGAFRSVLHPPSLFSCTHLLRRAINICVRSYCSDNLSLAQAYEGAPGTGLQFGHLCCILWSVACG